MATGNGMVVFAQTQTTCFKINCSNEFRSNHTVSPLTLRRLCGEENHTQSHTHTGFLLPAQSAIGGIFMIAPRLVRQRRTEQFERNHTQTHTHAVLS